MENELFNKWSMYKSKRYFNNIRETNIKIIIK